MAVWLPAAFYCRLDIMRDLYQQHLENLRNGGAGGADSQVCSEGDGEDLGEGEDLTDALGEGEDFEDLNGWHGGASMEDAGEAGATMRKAQNATHVWATDGDGMGTVTR